jgi:hypothetical protein
MFKGNVQTSSAGQHSTLTKEVAYSSVPSAHICQILCRYQSTGLDSSYPTRKLYPFGNNLIIYVNKCVATHPLLPLIIKSCVYTHENFAKTETTFLCCNTFNWKGFPEIQILIRKVLYLTFINPCIVIQLWK